MPIKKLTDGSDPGSGIPTILKLYKGDEKEVKKRANGTEYETVGKDLPYFRAEFEDQYEDLREVWETLYGPEPTEFPEVFLTAPTVDEAFGSWKEEWNSSQTLLHRCDGEHQVQWYSEESKMMCSAKIACAANGPKPCNCKNTGRLKLIIPEFLEAAGVFGYVSVTTHSLNDILKVYRYLSDIQGLYGNLLRIPFVFGRASKTISAPKQVKKGGEYVTEGRIKITKSLFYIDVTEDFARQRLLTMFHELPALPAPAAAPTSVISSKEGAALLQPGKSRRIDTGVNNGKPAETTTPTHPRVLADPAKLAALEKFAAQKLDYGLDDILFALEQAADYPLYLHEEWRGTEVEAIGALIAAYCAYDPAAIDTFTSKGGYRIDHRDAALHAVAIVQAKDQGVLVETTEAELI